MTIATVEVEDGLCFALPASPSPLGEELLLDVTIESVLDHILSPVRKEVLDHLPFGSVLTVDLDDGLILFTGEPAAPGLFVDLGSVAFLGAQWGDQFVIEHFGNLLPILVELVSIIQKQLVFFWGPELRQPLFGGQALVL